MINIFASVGRFTLSTTREAGAVSLFFISFVGQLIRLPLYFGLLMRQCEKIGFNSLPIVLLTAFFTGGVLALQSYHGFASSTLAATQVGPVVALSMLRELGPVLAGLMVAGRVGAAIAAEIGTMRVTEQVDALVTLATNPVKYLVVPRILACMLMVPMLVTIANVTGIYGGYVVADNVLNLNPHMYMETSFNSVQFDDILLGLIKALVFGTIIGIMGCYKGYSTKGGAEGVGQATTSAVVYASVMILIFDYFITALMM